MSVVVFVLIDVKRESGRRYREVVCSRPRAVAADWIFL